MKSKVILVSLIAILTVLTVALASASWAGVAVNSVNINGVDNVAGGQTISVDAGDTIPIKVVFTANENDSDVRVKAFISGYRNDITASTDRFETVNGRTYGKLFSLTVPSDVDPAEDYTLTVRVETKTDSFEQTYHLTIQRQSYSSDILNVEVPQSVSAGSPLAVNVVLKNAGSQTLDDNFVVASIPALGVSKKVYFGDLTPTDACINNEYCNTQDATERTLYLSVPADAKPGVYTLQVEASNPDSDTQTTKNIVVSGSQQISDVLVPSVSQDISAGQTAEYDLIIVNSGDRIASYEVVPESAQNLIVTVANPIVTVPADSSQTVKVKVQAGSVMGTFNFAVNVNSQGELVKKVNFSANVGKTGIAGSNIVILTIVLAVIFVVLLVVLIVLLTRKPEKVEEFGESYY